jgi:ADP-ribose pyrophosphatase
LNPLPVVPAAPPIARWQCREGRTHAECKVFQVRREVWSHPSLTPGSDFYLVDGADSVIVLARTTDNHYLMVEQFRFGSRGFSLEFPAGLLDPDEDPLVGARRELEEETGYTADHWQLLGSLYPNPAIQRSRCHFVFAWDARQIHAGRFDTHEELVTHRFTWQGIHDASRDGRIAHAMVHTGLWFLRDHYQQSAGHTHDI